VQYSCRRREEGEFSILVTGMPGIPGWKTKLRQGQGYDDIVTNDRG
jgi:hypothetical protein